MRASERWFLQGIIRHYDLFLFVSVCARYKFMAEMTRETLDVCASWFEIMSFGDTVEDRVHLRSRSSQFSGRGRGGQCWRGRWGGARRLARFTASSFSQTPAETDNGAGGERTTT